MAIIKAFSEQRLLDFVTHIIFASNKVVNYYKNLIADSQMQYSGTKDLNNLNPKGINIFTCWDDEVSVTPGVMNDIGGKYGVRSLMVATQCLKDGQLDGLLTNTIHKKNTQRTDFNYSVHKHMLKKKLKKTRHTNGRLKIQGGNHLL